MSRSTIDPASSSFSLDAASALAVAGARSLYSLPYVAERLDVHVWPPESLGDLRRWRSISRGTSPDASRFAPRA
jgi:uncharacterized protein YqjF (DUF2071 family)